MMGDRGRCFLTSEEQTAGEAWRFCFAGAGGFIVQLGMLGWEVYETS